MSNSSHKSTAEIYKLDSKKYQRFPEQRTSLNRSIFDPNYEFYDQDLQTNMKKLVETGELGYNRVDLALYAAAWTVNEKFFYACNWDPANSSTDFITKEIKETPPENHSPEELTQYIKRAAKFMGASDVGVTKIDENWLYKTEVSRHCAEPTDKDLNKEFHPLNLPENIKNAIVMVVEMDSDAIRTAPTFLAAASSGLGYSKMAFIIACVAEFIRNMGYIALPAWNDKGPSIPLAIDAGLGTLGRNGLLLTKKWGPRVRICKIFTNMPLRLDHPDEKFIKTMTNYCQGCSLCAEACETEAISFEKLPRSEPYCPSNNPGVTKWFVDVDKCFKYWIEKSDDCGKCIMVCPFSKTGVPLDPSEFWNQK
ncbi:MAG: reductive dehalogenase [Promethearchaeota archaeon]